MINTLKATFPVCFLSKNSLLIFRKGLFFIIDLTSGKISKLIKTKTLITDILFMKLPLFQRIFRKGVRCGMKISEKLVLVLIGRKIFELDVINGQMSNGFITSDDSRPLNFTQIEGIIGFEDGIYFGGYKGNPEKNPISIFRRTHTDKWEEVYQFQPGAIEHIHNIIPDPYKNIVYIFTGDFDHSAGIWKAQDGFRTVVPILLGSQLYRACVGFSIPEGLIYATDSPFSKNSIRLLNDSGKEWTTIPICDINGPSIYGCRWGNDFVFSTSVEGDGRNQNTLSKLFGRKRGSGIAEDYSFIYKGNLEEGFKEIYRAKKDCLPFYLFQFGTLNFANGFNDSSYLPVYHLATTRNNMNTILI